MRVWALRQLRSRVLVSLSLTAVFILGADSLFSVRNRLEELRALSLGFMATQVQFLQLYDYTRIGEDLNSFAKNQDAGYAEIRNAQGILISSWARSSDWRRYESKRLETEERSIGASIRFANGRFVLTYRAPLQELGSSERLTIVYSLVDWLRSIALRALLLFSFLGGFLLWNVRAVRRSTEVLVSPIERFTRFISGASTWRDLAGRTAMSEGPRITEFEALGSAFDDLGHRLKTAELEREKHFRSAALGEIASQVAHDIRSPLAALNMISKDIEDLPEMKRVLLRNAVNRIREISEDLLANHRKFTTNAVDDAVEKVTGAHEASLITALLAEIVAEKRAQYGNTNRVLFEFSESSEMYGVFVNIPANAFMRVMSNLINNSVEAIEGNGSVRVCVTAAEKTLEISITDDGLGIAPEVLAQINAKRSVSFGKTEGSGLGLLHAMNSVESWGGRLEIESRPDVGTTVRLTIARALAPNWFVSNIQVDQRTTMVILDDDTSIHGIWKNRLQSLVRDRSPRTVHHFFSTQEVREWAKSVDHKEFSEALYLFDYELRGETTNGLELIEELGIHKRSILVSSRYEEKNVREECRRIGVRMIPKGLAGFVPIRAV